MPASDMRRVAANMRKIGYDPTIRAALKPLRTPLKHEAQHRLDRAWRRRTGKLRKAISTRHTQRGLRCYVSSRTAYGRYLERGTRDGRIRANPFVRPAVADFAPRAAAAVAAEIERVRL
jgi:HK97 gp10 family phage protein